MAINVRDILRSDVYRLLREAGLTIHLFTPAAGVPAFEEEFGGPRVSIHPLVLPRDRVFRAVEAVSMKLHALLLSLRCDTLRIMLGPTLRRNPLARWSRALVGALGRPFSNLLLAASRLLLIRLSPRDYDEAFRLHRPDLVVGTRVISLTSPSRPEAARYLDRHLFLAAARLGVPRMVLVSSWDNLTTAGFFPAVPDRITVWNETMKREAVEIHDLPPERVVVTGAPQHDAYASVGGTDPAAASAEREAFFARMGLDPGLSLVVYTTQTEGTVPGEPVLADRIYRGLRDELDGAVQILVRLHQLDRRDRYRHLEGLPGLALDQAGKPPPGAYHDRDFDRQALQDLASTLHFADVVVNTASSISIDAAAVGTPVVAVLFDAEGPRPYDRSVVRFYDFTHQVGVVRSGGVALAGDMDELTRHVKAYLEDPTRDREGRERLVREQCYRIDGRSGARVAAAILDLLAWEGPPDE